MHSRNNSENEAASEGRRKVQLGDVTQIRLRIRNLFCEVDGTELVRQSKAAAQSPLSDLARLQPSSIYTIPLLQSTAQSETIMEFGPIRNPETLGVNQDGGMLLWCSDSVGQAFVELAKISGNRSASWRATESGSIIELGNELSDTEVIMLAMHMVIDLISAFDIEEVDQAATEQSKFETDKEILEGRPSDRINTI